MDTDLAALKAEVAGLAGTLKTEMQGVKERLSNMETTQKCLVEQMTAGRTTVKVLRWIGGVVLAIAALAGAFWDRLGG